MGIRIKMEDLQKIFIDLAANGFSIIPHNDKFLVNKISVPDNTDVISACEFEDYVSAFEFAKLKLLQPSEWKPIVRYNRGLGIEYKNLANIKANSKEEALEKAKNETLIYFKDSLIQVLEVKVFPKF